jgi:hypothetical protein
MTYPMPDDPLAPLSAPVRNRYFYGKMLDVRHLEMEQDYELAMRRLGHRLGLGSGVLCGLDVALGEAGLLIRPGVAIDGLGREIVVPAGYCVTDPAQPTDDSGRPAGDPVRDGTVTVLLCYAECPSDPTPVLVGDCDSRNGFAPGSTTERFRVIVRANAPQAAPGLTADQCAQLFPASATGPGLRATACAVIPSACATPEESCVVLATVSVDATGVPSAVDGCGPRTTLYSNARLFDLLACLAQQVATCCARPSLRYVAGDAQQGAAGDTLPVPLQVQVVDHAGGGVDGVDVTFHVQAGAGQVAAGGAAADAVIVPSSGGGQAAATLTLGATPGPASVEATLEDGARVVFSAWGVPPPPAEPPVVLGTVPAPAAVIDPGDGADGSAWVKTPVLEVVFDQKMDDANLAVPDDWLRLWAVSDPGDARTGRVRRLPLGLADVQGDGPSTASYRVDLALDGGGVAVLVQMRAEGTAIMSAAAPLQLLDAEFGGTAVPPEILEKIWAVDAAASFPRALWDALTDTGARLPKSGDGSSGGLFHSWFKIIRLR